MKLDSLLHMFSKTPSGHYEFRVSEGVLVDKSVFEEWKDNKAIRYALESQIERARKRANVSYDRLLNALEDSK